jgi:hypothetical protein
MLEFKTVEKERDRRESMHASVPDRKKTIGKKTLGNGESKGDRQIKQLAAIVIISEIELVLWLGLAPRRCMQKSQMMQTQRCDLFFLYARIVFYTIMYNTTYS